MKMVDIMFAQHVWIYMILNDLHTDVHKIWFIPTYWVYINSPWICINCTVGWEQFYSNLTNLTNYLGRLTVDQNSQETQLVCIVHCVDYFMGNLSVSVYYLHLTVAWTDTSPAQSQTFFFGIYRCSNINHSGAEFFGRIVHLIIRILQLGSQTITSLTCSPISVSYFLSLFVRFWPTKQKRSFSDLACSKRGGVSGGVPSPGSRVTLVVFWKILNIYGDHSLTITLWLYFKEFKLWQQTCWVHILCLSAVFLLTTKWFHLLFLFTRAIFTVFPDEWRVNSGSH